MLSLAHTTSSIRPSDATVHPLITPPSSSAEEPSARLLSPSGSEKVCQEPTVKRMVNTDHLHQAATGSLTLRNNSRIRSASEHERNLSPQSVALPPPAAPLPPRLSSTVGASAPASPTKHDVPAREEEEEEEPVQTRPRKRGIAQKRTITPKRKRMNLEADNNFIVRDDLRRRRRCLSVSRL